VQVHHQRILQIAGNVLAQESLHHGGSISGVLSNGAIGSHLQDLHRKAA
jgi:hypothetical protein